MWRLFYKTNTVAIGLCGAVMIVLGSWIPPMIEAPQPPKIGIEESKEAA